MTDSSPSSDGIESLLYTPILHQERRSARMTGANGYGCGRCSICGSFLPYDEMYVEDGDWICVSCAEDIRQDADWESTDMEEDNNG